MLRCYELRCDLGKRVTRIVGGKIEFCRFTTCTAERSSRKAQTASAPAHPQKKNLIQEDVARKKRTGDSSFLSKREWKTLSTQLRGHFGANGTKNSPEYPEQPHNPKNPEKSGNPKKP